ncbi:hypothetical protein [Mycobacteroides abscessus]|uniref:Uncharacterized protein n=2 Tax=Mycobacteroides abscessus TaxID=36809 RepID=A0A829MBJ0_9MYCO|nr:hypothetical protein [Mycobacteroides abscessus]ESV58889.1 hypothetical protein L830_4741 [Mycobacteroides abscessus MAB_082312_2258]ESV62271.1 hypothetical protein L833_4676 [Mycobacteroides abscessus MAB_091912_2446]QSM04434.1 hypothetical protein PROPHIGD02-2_26 [Mycobacterium phage prophiGD02-2]QST87296.1 hypothetical protein PROPHIGD90-1_26 [Mycobacterium phage prophiGD90-1]AWG55583.1 hypothetical protein DDT53_16050 [Mycobacteroides abscessus]
MNRQMRIAVAAEFRKLADKIEREEKSKFLLENDPGTRIPVMSDVEVDGKKRRIGYVLISDPEGPRDMPVITDEAAAIAWALEEFNDPMLAERKLTEQGRRTVLASADSALAAGAPLPPGVEVQHVPGGNPTVSWRGEDDARELLEDMQSRGLFTLSTALRMKELP